MSLLCFQAMSGRTERRCGQRQAGRIRNAQSPIDTDAHIPGLPKVAYDALVNRSEISLRLVGSRFSHFVPDQSSKVIVCSNQEQQLGLDQRSYEVILVLVLLRKLCRWI